MVSLITKTVSAFQAASNFFFPTYYALRNSSLKFLALSRFSTAIVTRVADVPISRWFTAGVGFLGFAQYVAALQIPMSGWPKLIALITSCTDIYSLIANHYSRNSPPALRSLFATVLMVTESAFCLYLLFFVCPNEDFEGYHLPEKEGGIRFSLAKRNKKR